MCTQQQLLLMLKVNASVSVAVGICNLPNGLRRMHFQGDLSGLVASYMHSRDQANNFAWRHLREDGLMQQLFPPREIYVDSSPPPVPIAGSLTRQAMRDALRIMPQVSQLMRPVLLFPHDYSLHSELANPELGEPHEP